MFEIQTKNQHNPKADSTFRFNMSSSKIEQEIAAAERALSEATEECRRRESTDEDTYANSSVPNNLPLESRIQSLQVQTQDLLFAHNMAEYYMKQQQSGSAEEDDWQRLQALARLLLSADPNETSSPLYQRLISEEYVPLHAYVRSHFQRRLRQELARIQYPSLSSAQWNDEDGGDREDEQLQSATLLQTSARTLHEIAILHQEVMVMGSSPPGHAPAFSSQFDPVLPELCRPIVERVVFHFVPPALLPSHHAPSKDLHAAPPPATLTRIDRLPEWLLGYLREHVFQPNGPWEFLLDNGLLDLNIGLNERVGGGGGGGAACSGFDFLNEMIRLVQWVLADRDFFRNALVSGPSSQPMVLCRAIEQLLQFDAFLQSEVLLPPLPDEENKNGYRDAPASSVLQRRRVVSLMDVCVAGDDELFAWWMNRERESVISTLFDPDAIVPAAPNERAALCIRRVSPRAELFCALVQSVRNKAAVFTFSAPYIANVASPLCMRFVDALHETATDLTRQLTGRHLPSRCRNQVPSNSELQRIVTAWIELINGAQMATQTLLNTTSMESDQATPQPHSGGAVTSSDEDMARFGRSLERLQGVMLDDFVTSVVEVLVMERAKFAGYLMRCSHLLASASEDYIVGGINVAKLCDISPDLVETHRVMTVLLECFDANMMPVDSLDSFAPGLMLERIMSMIAEKLLEVALDLQGMTPDLLRPGCILFARDVVALFGECPHLPNHALRVLDVVQLMRMESAQLGGIGGALCGLAGLPAPLTEADFEMDERLFEEAVSMIRAKGLLYVELADVFAVLNRRRDL
jgi:hypothetical protein